jgi:hypothetical protein
VAKNGALPFLALALMRGNQVKDLLEQTRAKVGDLPWGVGLLGFLPHSMLEEQCNAVWACKPTFALLAGGRPDQAAKFESRGIPTYIHAPAPALLKMYIEQGAKRFVFEGRECGGHIGPLASFPLWEQMIEMLLAEVKPGSEANITCCSRAASMTPVPEQCLPQWRRRWRHAASRWALSWAPPTCSARKSSNPAPSSRASRSRRSPANAR